MGHRLGIPAADSPAGPRPTVVALLPRFRATSAQLCATIEAAHQQRGTAILQVVVIDNNPRDPLALSADVSSELTVLSPGLNLGYAGALELGRRSVMADFLWTLQDDVVPALDCLDFLVKTMRDSTLSSRVAVVTPAEHNGQSRAPLTRRAIVDLVSGQFVPRPTEPSGSLAQVSHYDRRGSSCEYVWLSGALVDAIALEEVGGFDPRFWPLMFVDADVAVRLQRSGYKLASSPQAVIHHSRDPARYVALPFMKGVAFGLGRQRLLEKHGLVAPGQPLHPPKQSKEKTPVPPDILAAVAKGIGEYNNAYIEHVGQRYGRYLRLAQAVHKVSDRRFFQRLRWGVLRLLGR